MNRNAVKLIVSAVILLGAEYSSAISCMDSLTGATTSSFGASGHAEMMKAEGDFIHSIWQTGNSYRTRYKAMKSEDGSPVTDIAKYIGERNIPVEYRGYYYETTKGTYEEDIKKISNQWLAPNNSKENSDGAKSYIENLATMIKQKPQSASEAAEAVLNSLRAIHVEWYRRNSSWTVPDGEPKTFDEANIEAQYNGALQYYKIAERHDVLKDQLWQQAFHSVMEALVQKKFAPYTSMDVVDSYLAMTHKTGAKPSIIGDEHVNHFFDSRFQNFDFRMPSNGSEEPSAVLAFLNSHFPSIKGIPSSQFEIKAPPVPPGSSARIYLIKDKNPGGKGIIAVVKIQAQAAGLDEIVSTLAAEKGITSSSEFSPVKTLAYGKLGADDYFMVQEAAKTFEADQAFAGDVQARMRMVIKVSKALATMHGLAAEYSGDALKSISADLTTFRGNCFYDVRQMRGFLKNNRNDVITPAVRDGYINDSEGTELEKVIETLSGKYSRIVELTPEKLSPAVIHGDFHGGNLFLTNENDNSKLIDFGGSTWFIGKKIGTGDRGNDLGRMIGNVLVESTRHNLDLESEILPLIENLLSSYNQGTGIRPGSNQEANLKVSALFYMNRFLAVNANDVAGKKFKPLAGDNLTSLRQRLYFNWIMVLRSLNRELRTTGQVNQLMFNKVA